MVTFLSRLLSPAMLSLSQIYQLTGRHVHSHQTNLNLSLAECSERHSREAKFMGRPELIKSASDSSL
jgi:hypothetical protein